MSDFTWVPADVPLDKPNVARMYDHYLGGYHNFAIDRQAAEAVIAVYPDFPLAMRANRAFLRRAVQFLVAQGIDQFLDIGSGIPTVGNVHEVAQQINPAARVLYVDADPVAVAHSEAILQGNPRAAVLHADARQVGPILASPQARRLLDLERPLAVLLLTVLHFVTDDGDAEGLVRGLRQALAPGSYLVISHGTPEHDAPADVKERVIRLYGTTSNPARPRSFAQVGRFFQGWELLEPGLVFTPLWRPDGGPEPLADQPARSATIAGVGRKPATPASDR